jgi:hypothetical protein
MKRNKIMVLMLVLLIPGFVSADDWIDFGVVRGECEGEGCEIEFGSFLPVGQYEISVEAYNALGLPSGKADADKPLAVVEVGTGQAVINQLKNRGWVVKTVGDSMRVLWQPSTYKVDGVDTPVPEYRAFYKVVPRIGPCTVPCDVSIQ